MSKFNWLDDYKINNETIDQQHQHLFALANKAYEADNKKAISNCAMELFQYIREHFKDEELLMKQANYPGYQEHVLKHDELLVKLGAISTGLPANKFDTNDLNRLMEVWLHQHILEEDRLIGRYLEQQKPQ